MGRKTESNVRRRSWWMAALTVVTLWFVNGDEEREHGPLAEFVWARIGKMLISISNANVVRLVVD